MRRRKTYNSNSILREAGDSPGEIGSNLWYWLRRKLPALSKPKPRPSPPSPC